VPQHGKSHLQLHDVWVHVAGTMREQPAHGCNSAKLCALHKFDSAAVAVPQIEGQLHKAGGTPAGSNGRGVEATFLGLSNAMSTQVQKFSPCLMIMKHQPPACVAGTPHTLYLFTVLSLRYRWCPANGSSSCGCIAACRCCCICSSIRAMARQGGLCSCVRPK
jgi:hypothetical protein